MIFDYIYRLEISNISWLFFGVSIGHWFLGIHYIYMKIFRYENSQAQTNKSSYNEQRINFITEYDRCNPMTQSEASKEYLLYLKSKIIFYL